MWKSTTGERGRPRNGVRLREGEDYTTLSQQKVMVPFQRTAKILLKEQRVDLDREFRPSHRWTLRPRARSSGTRLSIPLTSADILSARSLEPNSSSIDGQQFETSERSENALSEHVREEWSSRIPTPPTA